MASSTGMKERAPEREREISCMISFGWMLLHHLIRLLFLLLFRSWLTSIIIVISNHSRTSKPEAVVSVPRIAAMEVMNSRDRARVRMPWFALFSLLTSVRRAWARPVSMRHCQCTGKSPRSKRKRSLVIIQTCTHRQTAISARFTRLSPRYRQAITI